LGLGDDAFRHFAFVIDSAPEVVCHPVDLHVDLVQVPLPVAMGAHSLDALAPDLPQQTSGQTCSTKTHGFVAAVDATLVQQILNIAKRQREAGCRASPTGG
jgi:hypothetical protein